MTHYQGLFEDEANISHNDSIANQNYLSMKIRVCSRPSLLALHYHKLCMISGSSANEA